MKERKRKKRDKKKKKKEKKTVKEWHTSVPHPSLAAPLGENPKKYMKFFCEETPGISHLGHVYSIW